MTGPFFFDEHEILALHARVLQFNNGPSGHKHDQVCAIAAYPQQKLAYADPVPSIPELAGYYGFAAAKLYHAFTEGNKRVSFYLIVLFLRDHGYDLDVAQMDAARFIEQVADGSRSEAELVQWVVDHARLLRFRPITRLLSRLGLDWFFQRRTRHWRN